MLIEDYVSFETAKLLKEKGFDEESWCVYDLITKKFAREIVDQNFRYNHGLPNYVASAPTLQMAIKWLREVHRIIITTDYRNICGLGFTYAASIIKISNNGEIDEGDGLNVCLYKHSYEEACETAIKYCLENLF